MSGAFARREMRRALVTAVIAVLGLFVAGVFWAGDFLTKPARASTGVPDPALHARSLTFDSVSGVKLSAWFVPGSSGAGAILLLHAVRSNKRTMLPRAQFLSALGFSVLLVDLQAHGESEGERISFGYREAADVHASVEKLRELAPGERVGVLGTSLGAASLLLSDVQPLLAAVILESLYPSIEEAVANRLHIYFGAVGPWLSPLLLAQLSPRLGVTPAQLRPIQRVSLLRCPYWLSTAPKTVTLRSRRPSGSSQPCQRPRSFIRCPARRMSICMRSEAKSMSVASEISLLVICALRANLEDLRRPKVVVSIHCSRSPVGTSRVCLILWGRLFEEQHLPSAKGGRQTRGAYQLSHIAKWLRRQEKLRKLI